MLPEWGFTDSVADFTGVDRDTASTDALFNPFAAVPSMHVAFALMLGVPMVADGAPPLGARRCGARYPPLVTFVVDRDRQPLVVRRRHRRARRRRLRASPRRRCSPARGPHAWAWDARAGRARAGARPARLAGAYGRRPRPNAPPRTAREYQTQIRNRLIESRLTPNAISLTGFALCVVAAVLDLAGAGSSLGGIAFIVGSVCDTLDGRYSRMSGKGTPFGAFLDSTLDRIEEGIVLAAVALPLLQRRATTLAVAAVVRRGARLADGLLHARPRRGARRRVQGRHRRPRRAGRHPVCRAWCFGEPRRCSSPPSTCWPRWRSSRSSSASSTCARS